MKKTFYIGILVLLLLCLPSIVSAAKYSIGAFGGINIPIAQDDTKPGALFGVKGRIPLLPFLAVEPNFVTADFKGKDLTVQDTLSYARKGGSFTSFGADLVVGTFSGMSKLKFYGLAGINTNTYKREGMENKTGLGFTIGTGLEFFPTDILSVEIRSRYHPIKIGDGGRAHVEISGGLNYYFGHE
jgi:hypothetical protein